MPNQNPPNIIIDLLVIRPNEYLYNFFFQQITNIEKNINLHTQHYRLQFVVGTREDRVSPGWQPKGY